MDLPKTCLVIGSSMLASVSNMIYVVKSDERKGKVKTHIIVWTLTLEAGFGSQECSAIEHMSMGFA